MRYANASPRRAAERVAGIKHVRPVLKVAEEGDEWPRPIPQPAVGHS